MAQFSMPIQEMQQQVAYAQKIPTKHESVRLKYLYIKSPTQLIAVALKWLVIRILRILKLLGSLDLKFLIKKKALSKYPEVIDFIQKWDAQRDQYAYEIDGMVVKVDEIALQKCVVLLTSS